MNRLRKYLVVGVVSFCACFGLMLVPHETYSWVCDDNCCYEANKSCPSNWGTCCYVGGTDCIVARCDWPQQ
jgi:hypothetical protein